MDKAQLERLTQLALAAQGKKTKRPVEEILASERSAAEKYIARAKPTATMAQPTETEGVE